MKRILALMLLFLYVIPTMGVNISVHYCGGQIASVSFGLDNANKCSCNGKAMKKNCCEDKKFSFQLNDEQNKTPQFSLNIAKSFDHQPAFVSVFDFQNSPVFVPNTISYKHHPRDKVKQPLFILHQVFRI